MKGCIFGSKDFLHSPICKNANVSGKERSQESIDMYLEQAPGKAINHIKGKVHGSADKACCFPSSWRMQRIKLPSLKAGIDLTCGIHQPASNAKLSVRSQHGEGGYVAMHLCRVLLPAAFVLSQDSRFP